MDRREQARFMVASLARMSAWMVAFLGLVELAALPVAWRTSPVDRAVDLAALAVTALFGLAVWIGPALALRRIDAESGAGDTWEARES